MPAKLNFTPRTAGTGSPAADVNLLAPAIDALIDDVAARALLTDTRLSDARPPTAHTQAATTITEDASRRFATDAEKAAIAANTAALTPLTRRNRATFGVYEPLFQNATGLANISGAFAVAAGGGLLASVAGTNAIGALNLPKVIDTGLPFRFAALVEYQAGTGTLKVTLTNSANPRSQVDFALASTGLTVNVGYGTLHNSLIGGLVAGQRYWFTVTGDGSQICVGLLPETRKAFQRLSSFQGPAQLDYAAAFAPTYVEGGNSTFVGLNQIVVTNSSATSKILGVWCSQEGGLGGPVDARLLPPAILLPTVLGDTTPIVRVPKNYTANGNTDLVLWLHPNASAENVGMQAADVDGGAACAYLVEQGYIVASSLGSTNATGYTTAEASNWGAYGGLRFRYALAKWCLENLPGIRHVYTVGLSMGGLNGLALHRTYPGLIRAHVGISGVTNLSYAYSPETFSSIINTANGTATLTQVKDQDPNLRARIYANLPCRLYHGTADTLISKANHADLFKTNVEAAGGSVTVVSVAGAAHLDQAALFDGPGIVSFFQANI